MVHTYFGIGQYIVEDEQQGMLRADYGDKTLNKFPKNYPKNLAKDIPSEILEICVNSFLHIRKE